MFSIITSYKLNIIQLLLGQFKIKIDNVNLNDFEQRIQLTCEVASMFPVHAMNEFVMYKAGIFVAPIFWFYYHTASQWRSNEIVPGNTGRRLNTIQQLAPIYLSKNLLRKWRLSRRQSDRFSQCKKAAFYN
jgi:hypothetical protein